MPAAPTADVVVAAMPVLRVDDAERSVRFYCGRLGFHQDWWHQAESRGTGHRLGEPRRRQPAS